MNWSLKSIAGYGLLGLIALVLLIQLVPYGRSHQDPPVVQEPVWPTTEARAIAERACFDCHSNETTWPWYASVAPVSWLIQHDVDEGRQKLDFSNWQGSGRRGAQPDEMSRVVERGEMPPSYYVLLHPAARLTAADQATLIQSLNQLASTR